MEIITMDYDSKEYQDLLAARRAERKARASAEPVQVPTVVEIEQPIPAPHPQVIVPISSINRIRDIGGSGG